MKKINTLLNKEMTRKEFLATMGFGVASLLGFSTVIKLLTGNDNPLERQSKNTPGYGSGAYGGERKA